MSLKEIFTIINERMCHDLGISRDEYALCYYVQQRQADPYQNVYGWCCDYKDEIADFVGVPPNELEKMINKMELIGVIEVCTFTGHLRVTPYFIDLQNK